MRWSVRPYFIMFSGFCLRGRLLPLGGLMIENQRYRHHLGLREKSLPWMRSLSYFDLYVFSSLKRAAFLCVSSTPVCLVYIPNFKHHSHSRTIARIGLALALCLRWGCNMPACVYQKEKKKKWQSWQDPPFVSHKESFSCCWGRSLINLPPLAYH